VVQGSNGVSVVGNGNPNNPYIASIDPHLAGQGLSIVGGVMSTHLAPDGGLAFDSVGGLEVVGGGGSTPRGANGLAVSDLELRNVGGVIGGVFGLGYMIKPECYLRSYRMGADLGVDMMVVPVRMLSDATPVSYTDQNLDRLVDPNDPTAATWAATSLEGVNVHRAAQIWSEAGTWNPRQAWQPPFSIDPTGTTAVPAAWSAQFATAWQQAARNVRSPSYGWFGYNEENQYGLTTLGGVLREVGGKTPMLLDLRFPNMTGATFDEAITQWWRIQAWLSKIAALVNQFGLSQYVVVCTNLPVVPANAASDGPSAPFDVLQFFINAGLRACPKLVTAADIAAYPPDSTWNPEWTWAVLDATLGASTISSYVGAAAEHVMVYNCSRQNDINTLVNPTGARGTLSADPLYTAAVMTGLPTVHPLNVGFAYKVSSDGWANATVDHGSFPPIMGPGFVSAALRGHHETTRDVNYLDPTCNDSTRPNVGISWNVLQGWLCPIFGVTPTLTFKFTVSFDTIVAGTVDTLDTNARNSEWMTFCFGVPVDSDYSDWWTVSNKTPAPAGRPLDTGYTLHITQTGLVRLIYQAAGASTQLASGTPFTQISAGGQPKTLQVGWNANGIKVVDLTAGAGNKVILSATGAQATANRGPYAYLGRYSAKRRGGDNTTAWLGFFQNLSYTYVNAGP
jgi:hypothetical protein